MDEVRLKLVALQIPSILLGHLKNQFLQFSSCYGLFLPGQWKDFQKTLKRAGPLHAI